MATVCQLAATSSAPRLRRCFRSKRFLYCILWVTVIFIPRVVRIGIVAAVVAALSGWVVERVRFGASDEAAVALVEAELGRRIGAAAQNVPQIATSLVTARDTIA